MAIAVCSGAMITCSFGTAPGSLNILPDNKTFTSTALGTIMDNKAMTNISPFGMCTSLANPQVASATSAALGVLTPMPCMPAISAPWIPGSPTVLLNNYPVLNNSCKLMCNWGGVITIGNPGQGTVQVP